MADFFSSDRKKHKYSFQKVNDEFEKKSCEWLLVIIVSLLLKRRQGK